jgi:uncharacterized membrane protein YgaE (UPF0421/DUF939 family)
MLGVLHVVEALAGVSAIYRMPDAQPRSLVLSGGRLVGLAFGGGDSMVVASNDTAWLFAA